MKRLPQIALLPDGKRLHLQDGPIDLIIEAKGREADVRAAYEAAARRFTGLLDELCEELVELRQAADPVRCPLKGVVARRMHAAVAPFAAAALHHADGGGGGQRRGRNSRRDAGARRGSTAPMSIMAATSRCIWPAASNSPSA